MTLIGAVPTMLVLLVLGADMSPTVSMPANVRLDPLTAPSLFLDILEGGCVAGSATGFVVVDNGQPFLITNGHVVTCRNARTGARVLNATPDGLRIHHHGLVLGTWQPRIEPLYTAGVKRWLEHPRGLVVDVVALPLSNLPADSVRLAPLEFSHLADVDMRVDPAGTVSVVGFPLALRGPYGFAIWKTGHVASDPDLDFDGEPSFLVDATTRSGMSGSPVYLRQVGGFTSKTGNQTVTPGVFTRFLGVYSAQFEVQELGYVWKPSVITEVLGARHHAK
jgi:hypothetical protein